ncbi:MAG TPA: PCRF domain-containing protein, partial [Bacilli bacterium]|nr:PCRF domain-containing protein [Bacilli bacterium]
MKDRLEGMKNRYEQINQMLSDVSIVSDLKKLKELSKEQRQLEKIVVCYQDLLDAEKELQDLKTLVKDEDPDIRDMAQDELEKCLAKIEKIE